MPLSRKYNTILVHIPKTGGSFITNRILRMGNKKGKEKGKGIHNFFGTTDKVEYTHLTAMDIKNILGEETYDSFFSCAFVRNPFDRLVSEFFYLKRQKNANKGFIKENNFKKFIHTLYNKFHLVTETAQYKINHYIPQYKFIMDEKENIIVDFVGRFESFDKDIKYILKKVGTTPNMSKTNTTTHKHYKHYYDDEMIKMVREMYKKDLEFFNYEF